MNYPKPQTYRSKKYLSYIRSLACVICDSPGAHAHHTVTGGKGLKGSDFKTVPLCIHHHIEVHGTGKDTFQEKYNIDFKDIIIKNLEDYIMGINE